MLDGRSNNVQAALDRIYVLIGLQSAFALSAMDERFDSVQRGRVFSRLYEATYVNPRYYFARTSEADYVFISGVGDEAAARRLWDGYINAAVPEPNGVVNGALELWASTLRNNRDIAARAVNIPVYICGHSAGGAVACYLADKLRVAFPGVHTVVTSFGSPRPAGNWLSVSDARLDLTRWMNADDPVPVIPPRPDTWPRVVAGLSVFQGRRLPLFVHPAGGIELGLAGEMRPAELPSVPETPDFASMTAWLRAVQANLETPHALSVYQARLLLNLPAYQPDTAVGGEGGGGEGPTFLQAREAARALDRLAIVFNEDHARQNREPLVIPDERQFHAFRIRRLWFVKFNETIIACGPTKKSARGLARVGNELLRRLQRQGYVGAAEFAAQFSAYLALASDPSSGFSPQLRTAPP